MLPVICPYCSKPAELVTGSEMYPHRHDLYRKRFWRCSPCRAWVGCHPGTTEPLGMLAGPSLRRARQIAHEVFDRIWKHGHMKRYDAYGWLAQKLGIQRPKCHIGMMDEEACRRVVEVCREREVPRVAEIGAVQ